jgi:hypothetical protein
VASDFTLVIGIGLGPRLALESVAEVLAALVGLPLRLGC